ncbi:hypothetical protein IT072_02390 [Leifsonia sp. ZF2019]|uniref:hypothetical protein n=1 Tax=Leifsonia sp. ZF2019 TaxID=2781978 RepID=UPI001CBDE4A5|nr:hypothetical protein [Leifsonia sp. ZF2019]UAJ78316.1 hypothetical protein IT072_13715 [Leifsonia sp. ZF2019]UAJ79946.1 hypothetical protein IT072_02390 [Leifsonia sp. ZF2019]
MSEAVTRTRMVDSGQLDRYGKPILAPQTSPLTAHSFAPVVTNDVEGVDTVVSSDGGTLYFRAPDLAGSLSGDKWKVRGIDYESEGIEALWQKPSGEVVGTVIVLKRTELTRG